MVDTEMVKKTLVSERIPGITKAEFNFDRLSNTHLNVAIASDGFPL